MIFYFSGTGNTKWAVETLAKAIGDRVIFIPDVVNDHYHLHLAPNERIGICFPIHGWRPPTIVRKFIERLSIDNLDGNYVYALVTAGDTVGEAVDVLRSDLAKHNVTLHAACSLIMPESYVGLPFMDVDTVENERRKISGAVEKLEWFTAKVTGRIRGVEDLTIGNWPKVNTRIIGGFFHRYLVGDKPFHITADKCLGCGKCARSCPINNIAWEKGEMPKWNHSKACMACFSCYHHCPTHAIEYGVRTKFKGQYFFGKAGITHNNNG